MPGIATLEAPCVPGIATLEAPCVPGVRFCGVATK